MIEVEVTGHASDKLQLKKKKIAEVLLGGDLFEFTGLSLARKLFILIDNTSGTGTCI